MVRCKLVFCVKKVIILAVVAVSSGAKLDRAYLPPAHARTSGGNSHIIDLPNAGYQDHHNSDVTQAISNSYSQSNGLGNNLFAQDYAQDRNSDGSFRLNDGSFENGLFDINRPERTQAAFERTATIRRQENNNDVETYSYGFETSNGITAEQSGVATNGVQSQGGYSYTGDDGRIYTVRYTADENGFVPEGDHLPTPPPIPEEILEALNKNAEDEANGIFDDGSYNEGKYPGDQNGEPGYVYTGKSLAEDDKFYVASNGDDEDSVVTNNALLRNNNFGEQRQSRYGNKNVVDTAYLPPFQQNVQRVGAKSNGQYNQVEKAYLPPSQFGQRSFQAPGVNGAQNEIERAYLPPQQSRQVNRLAAKRNRGQNGIERAYLPPRQLQHNQQIVNSISQNGVERTYVPPEQFGQRNQQTYNSNNALNGNERTYLPPKQSERPNSQTFRNENNQYGLARMYLPPGQFGQRRNQVRNFNFANQNVDRKYLTPDSQRRNGFVSSLVFNTNELVY